jgi:hypothetical protein
MNPELNKEVNIESHLKNFELLLEKIGNRDEKIPSYARKALNKYDMVCEESILLERYKTVENQKSEEDMNNKILEYEQQDDLERQEYEKLLKKYEKIHLFKKNEEHLKKTEEEHEKIYTDAY